MGTIRTFDIRERNHEECVNCNQNIIINLKDRNLKSKTSVTSLSINPDNPVYLAAACSDSVVRIYDQRMIQKGRPVCDLCPDHIKKRSKKVFSNNRITSLEYSRSGKELLVSYTSEYVYLFRLNSGGERDCSWPLEGDSQQVESTSEDTDQAGSFPRIRLQGDWSDTGPTDANNSGVIHRVSLLFQRWLGEAIRNNSHRRAREQVVSEGEQGLRSDIEEDASRRNVEGAGEASETTAGIFSGRDFYSADESEGVDSDSVQMSDASEYFTPVGTLSQSPRTSTGSSRVPRNAPFSIPPVPSRINPYISTSNGELSAEQASHRLGRFWRMQRSRKRPGSRSDIEINEGGEGCSKDKHRRLSKERQFDVVDEPMSENVFIPKLEMRYKGHRNVRTMIKEATFIGDNFIASGSDDGRVFLWDRKSGEIVNVLLGDSRVVNCVQGHPFEPILATSGIDKDVKIWEPVAEHSCSLSEVDKVRVLFFVAWALFVKMFYSSLSL